MRAAGKKLNQNLYYLFLAKIAPPSKKKSSPPLQGRGFSNIKYFPAENDFEFHSFIVFSLLWFSILRSAWFYSSNAAVRMRDGHGAFEP